MGVNAKVGLEGYGTGGPRYESRPWIFSFECISKSSFNWTSILRISQVQELLKAVVGWTSKLVNFRHFQRHTQSPLTFISFYTFTSLVFLFSFSPRS